MKSNDDSIIQWDLIIKKEARGIDNADLGEVAEIDAVFVIVKRDTDDEEKLYLPKDLVERFDGDSIWFKITDSEAESYRKDYPGTYPGPGLGDIPPPPLQ